MNARGCHQWPGSLAAMASIQRREKMLTKHMIQDLHLPSQGDCTQGWAHQSIALTCGAQQGRRFTHIIGDLPCACAHTTHFHICIGDVGTSKAFLPCIAPQHRAASATSNHPRVPCQKVLVLGPKENADVRFCQLPCRRRWTLPNGKSRRCTINEGGEGTNEGRELAGGKA